MICHLYFYKNLQILSHLFHRYPSSIATAQHSLILDLLTLSKSVTMLASIFTMLATGAIAVLAVPTVAPLEYVHDLYSSHRQLPFDFLAPISTIYKNPFLVLEPLSRYNFGSILSPAATLGFTTPLTEYVVSCSPFCSNVILRSTSPCLLIQTHNYRKFPSGRFQ